MRSTAKVQQRLEELLLDRCGFDVSCIVLTPFELTGVYDDAMAIDPPFPKADGQRRFVVFFKDEVEAEVVEEMAAYDVGQERIWAIGRAAHVWIAGSFQDAKVFGAFKKALAVGTNRDLKVVTTLAERWGA
jgi:uncharacterized protein (DUF1697 family)